MRRIASLFKTLRAGRFGRRDLLVGRRGCSTAAALRRPKSLPPHTGAALATGRSLLALQGVIYTYDGWNAMLYFSEEVRDPGRDIPRGMVTGVLLVIAIYLLLNLAFLHVLPLSRMAGEPFVAGAAAAAVFGPRGDTIIRTIVILSSLAAVNACIMMGPRVPLAMARDGLLPRRITRVNRGGTPAAATVATALIALGFLLNGSFERVLSTSGLLLRGRIHPVLYLRSSCSAAVSPTLLVPIATGTGPGPQAWCSQDPLHFSVGQVVNDTRNSLWSLAHCWPRATRHFSS